MTDTVSRDEYLRLRGDIGVDALQVLCELKLAHDKEARLMCARVLLPDEYMVTPRTILLAPND